MTVEEAIYNILHAVYGEEVRDSLAEALRTIDGKTQADKEDAEAYAVGTRNGTEVEITDPTYHNNSKYYSDAAAVSVTHGPQLSENGTWLLWNGYEYVDSGYTASGSQGPQGIQGPEGPRGISGVAVSAPGQYAFNVNDEGHLILTYSDSDAPDFSINENGHLILTV